MVALPLRHSASPEFFPFFLPDVRPHSPPAILHPTPGSFLRQTGRPNKMMSGQMLAGSHHQPTRECPNMEAIECSIGADVYSHNEAPAFRNVIRTGPNNRFQSALEAETLKGWSTPERGHYTLLQEMLHQTRQGSNTFQFKEQICHCEEKILLLL